MPAAPGSGSTSPASSCLPGPSRDCIALQLYVAAFLPDPHRFAILAVPLMATMLWFVADEWLTRGRGAFVGGYALTKALFLVSLMLAVVLNLEELFFLGMPTLAINRMPGASGREPRHSLQDAALLSPNSDAIARSVYS